MRAPYLIRLTRLLGSPTMFAGLLFPALLVAQTTEKALQYQVGEIARETIVTSETIRVTVTGNRSDAMAEARTVIPPVYGYTSRAAVDAEAQLARDWVATKTDFLDALERVYGKRSFRTVETTSKAFTEFIASYQAGNTGFPFYDDLARRWASEDATPDDLEAHIERLNNFMTSYFIRPDEAPELTQTTADKLDLITLGAEEPQNVGELQAYPMANISPRQFIPISQAREIFLRQSDIQNRNFKDFLSLYIRPNTRFLETVSQNRWDQAPSGSTNEIVYEPGDIIVRQGEKISPVIKEALDLLIVNLRFRRIKESIKIELAREPGSVIEESTIEEDRKNEAVPVESPVSPPTEKHSEAKPEGKLPPILSPTTVAQSNPSLSIEESAAAMAAMTAGKPGGIISPVSLWILGGLVLALTGLFIVLHFRQSPPKYGLSEQPPAVIEDPKQTLIKGLTSQLTQTLFRQRQDLLKSKETATAQVAAMENRLAKLQPEIFDKLYAYEEKIKNLEAQLRQRKFSHNSPPTTPLGREPSNKPGPAFEKTRAPAPNEENYRSDDPVDLPDEEDKEVPFPGHTVHGLDEESIGDLMEEVLEDLEAEKPFEKRIAKGSSD